MAYDNGPKIVNDSLVCVLDAADLNSYPGSGTSILNIDAYGAFRCRVGTNPTRQIFVNNVSVADSGVNSTATITYGTTAAIIGAYDTGNYFHKGNLYMFRMYNRALTDVELTQNYNAQKSRFGL